MPKNEKIKIGVSVQTAYYKTRDSLCNVTEESLFNLDPVAETKISVVLEKNDDFDSNIDDLLKVDNLVPSYIEEESNVLYMTMCFDDEIVYKSIQKKVYFGE
ncbi:MAG: hypothetical protein NC310_01960 [Roseburia sp.]|nr:hypothetical protein [Roseburia sp.]MCM1556290.1 hypothetical protein [Anaeroplasma bactoclasticum]